MKKSVSLIVLVMFIFLLTPMISAYLGEFPVGECVDIKVLSGCSSINLSIVETDTITYVIDAPMTQLAGQTFNYSFCNTTEAGEYRYTWNEDCVDCSGGVCGNNFRVGENPNIPYTLMYVTLILLLIGLGFLYHHISASSDLEKWNKKLYQQYKDRNFVKMTLGVIGYHILKNKFIIYYLIGLPIMVVITQITLTFNMVGFHTVLQNFLIVYLVGVAISGIIFLSHIQEWLMDLFNMVRDMGWGIEK